MKQTDRVKIRMYRQGLGDCFLLTFYFEKDKKFNILIDCGVLSKSKEHVAIMNTIAESIKDETGNKIDVLVATHEHWDHLSGFLQAKSIFENIPTKEIWMAWTENPNDSFAEELKENQKNKLTAINLAYNKLQSQSTAHFDMNQKNGHDNYLKAFTSFFNFFGIDESDPVFNINGTADAFDTLRNRKNSTLVYLKPASNEVIELEELPGVRIYVLGPPKNAKALRKMNPSKKDSEVYELNYNLSIGKSFYGALEPEKDTYKPFLNESCIKEGDEESKNRFKTYYNKSNDWRTIDDDWLYSAGNLAIALDNSINNTSLVLAFEFIESGKVLLFPADAQVGNWLSWSNYEWTVQGNRGEKEKITVDDLLRRTVFYKVGHHGSHNATMRDRGLEKMTSPDLIAMIPVNKEMANSRRWKMPFKSLLESLNEKAKNRVIIQDEDFPDTIKTKNQVKEGITDLYFDIEIHNK